MDLELRPHAARMPGRIVITFDLNSVPDPLVLDFRDLDGQGKVIDVLPPGACRSMGIPTISTKPKGISSFPAGTSERVRIRSR